MKNMFHRIALAAGIVGAAFSLHAQPTAHYIPGLEGIKGSTLPPPGWYARDYNIAYASHGLRDKDGQRTGPPDFEAFTYGNAPRVIWITDKKVLGGFLGFDALIPVIFQKVRAGGWEDDTFGLGDFFAEATLSWHLTQLDLAVAAGAWMPTGNSEKPPTTRVGGGYWGTMFTAGATWFIDQEKTWAVSALNRYEINTEQRDTHVTPGHAYTLEWGASKTLAKVIDVGAVGYYQQKVTEDSGPRAFEKLRDRVAGAGPEINVVLPPIKTFVSLRYLYEFMAENRAQGSTVSLTLTKMF